MAVGSHFDLVQCKKAAKNRTFDSSLLKKEKDNQDKPIGQKCITFIVCRVVIIQSFRIQSLFVWILLCCVII